jgi:hypothetical protein
MLPVLCENEKNDREDELTNARTVRLSREHADLLFQGQLCNPILSLLESIFPTNAGCVC